MMFPRWFKAVKNCFERFGLLMASIFNFIFLIPVYFIGIGIVSVIGKCSSKDFLAMNSKKAENKETYWKSYNLKKEEKEGYYRMF